jgi:hypothetical protein
MYVTVHKMAGLLCTKDTRVFVSVQDSSCVRDCPLYQHICTAGYCNLDNQTWAYFLATCADDFSSILTSSTKLETVSITVRALNSYVNYKPELSVVLLSQQYILQMILNNIWAQVASHSLCHLRVPLTVFTVKFVNEGANISVVIPARDLHE